MNTRDSELDQITDDENAGLLGKLPNEMFLELAKHLPTQDLNNIRSTCRFFANHSLLKEMILKKTIHKVIAREDYTFWFEDGKVFGTGSNLFNALGLGKEVESCFKPMPIILPSQNPITKIVAGSDFTLFFDTEGNCYACGSNISDQLGGPTDSDLIIQYSFKKMHLPNGRPIVDAILGHTTTFLHDDRGSWFAMGDNESGKLGVNCQIRYIGTPILISLANGLPIAKIIPSMYDTFFQDIEGNWFQRGDHYLGETVSITAPELLTLPHGKPIVEIVAMLRSIFIRSQDGQWYASGDNSNKQLGHLWLRNYNSIKPIQLPNGQSIDKIVTSGNHTVIRDVDGKWFGCGSNNYGQLLQEKASMIGLTAIELPNHKQIAEIYLGDQHTLLKDREGNWYGCGKNDQGQLGPKAMMSGQVFSINPAIFEPTNEQPEMDLTSSSKLGFK